MNIADVIIIVLFVISILRGVHIGFFRSFLSLVGFVAGLFVGALLQHQLIFSAGSPLSRTIFSLALILCSAFLLSSVGEYLATLLKNRVKNLKVERADRVLGGAFGGITLLITVWLMMAALGRMPVASLQRVVRGSRVMALLDSSFPSPPSIFARIDRFFAANGFPNVFIGSEPVPNEPLASPSNKIPAATELVRGSVVKVEGYGCGDVVEGSGFVVAKDVIATNAHVIAGVGQPIVVDVNGVHTAQPFWFDPDLDLAFLRVDHLSGRPLHLDTTIAPANTAAAVLGYPGGGAIQARAATIIDSITAVGNNIYGQGSVKRSVYSIRSTIRPGNSGGPVIGINGYVLGMVFAESAQYRDIGYAITADQIVSALQQAVTAHSVVSTGLCAQ